MGGWKVSGQRLDKRQTAACDKCRNKQEGGIAVNNQAVVACQSEVVGQMVQIVMGPEKTQAGKDGRTLPTFYTCSDCPCTMCLFITMMRWSHTTNACSMLPALNDGVGLCYPRCRRPFSAFSTLMRTVARKPTSKRQTHPSHRHSTSSLLVLVIFDASHA
jgi:hypothetical protein